LIPEGFVQAWALQAPWPDPRQVEQDLLISRALHDLFRHPDLQGRLALRGGTAIHKLLMPEPLRYSEDIDLIHLQPGPIKPLLKAISDAMQWLGIDREVKQSGQSIKLLYRYSPVGAVGKEKRKLKIEINTVEHRACLDLVEYPFALNNPWFNGNAYLLSYDSEELIATKFRALLQRRKDRDLFDLGQAFDRLTLDDTIVLACFQHYLGCSAPSFTRANVEEILLRKLSKSLVGDINAR
jgi:predicted nucleotidyltransferase component of viral defense system